MAKYGISEVPRSRRIFPAINFQFSSHPDLFHQRFSFFLGAGSKPKPVTEPKSNRNGRNWRKRETGNLSDNGNRWTSEARPLEFAEPTARGVLDPPTITGNRYVRARGQNQKIIVFPMFLFEFLANNLIFEVPRPRRLFLPRESS